ncbi:MAG: DUF2244 domain-containing protein [Caulobacteraceae bacterium]
MAASPRFYMDAQITPHRSLSKGGFAVLLAVLVAYNLLVMVFLVAIGAFPVPIFLGLDFVGVLVAFRISYRRGGALERVQVSADEVRVSRRDRGAEHMVWTSPTAFTRVSIENAGEHETCVRLRLSGRSLSVGASLSPAERADFGSALERAILSARAERHPA